MLRFYCSGGFGLLVATLLITAIFAENYIDGSEFVGLSDAEIREMVPPIGLAKKIITQYGSTVYIGMAMGGSAL